MRFKGRYASYENFSGRLVVLVDEFSSASEIVSGAIQDWDRGLIVSRIVGKGLVQRPIQLGDGSDANDGSEVLHSGSRCIQKPYEDGVEAYRSEKYNRWENGEMQSLDSLDLPDSLKFETNIRTVYGGGGILPDIFVPIDTSSNSESFMKLLRKGLLSEYALSYVDNNRTSLEKRYPTEDGYVANHKFLAKEIKDLRTWCADEGLEITEEDWAISGDAMLIRLRAFMGRNLFESRTFYRIIGDLNESLQEAIQVLHDGRFEKSKLAFKTFK